MLMEVVEKDGKAFLADVGRPRRLLHCKTHIALLRTVISKGFRSGSRIAYLFDKVVNVIIGEKEDRMMTTGLHTVMDVNCVACQSLLGWTYEFAYEESQKYKEGKFVLERGKLLGPGEEDEMAASDEED